MPNSNQIFGATLIIFINIAILYTIVEIISADFSEICSMYEYLNISVSVHGLFLKSGYFLEKLSKNNIISKISK